MLTAVAKPDDVGRKTCFVAMPVTTPASYVDDLRDADHFGHVLKHLFTPALEQAGYTVIPPKMLGATLIHAEIIRNLEQADLVFADLSNHNPNVFFELGIRTSLDRSVVLVKDARTSRIPFDLGTINVLTYDESLATWTLDEEIKRLAEHVSNVPTDDASGNAMWRYFGLTKRGDPAEEGSLEAKVDLLLAEITKLRLAPQSSALTEASTFTGEELLLTQLLRHNWKEILDLVKERRRVAWMLLSAAEVDSATGNTLTLRFGKDGQAKGFITSGQDSVLVEVLNELIGIKPRIIAKSPEANYISSSLLSRRSAPASTTTGPGERSSADDSYPEEPPFKACLDTGSRH